MAGATPSFPCDPLEPDPVPPLDPVPLPVSPPDPVPLDPVLAGSVLPDPVLPDSEFGELVPVGEGPGDGVLGGVPVLGLLDDGGGVVGDVGVGVGEELGGVGSVDADGDDVGAGPGCPACEAWECGLLVFARVGAQDGGADDGFAGRHCVSRPLPAAPPDAEGLPGAYGPLGAGMPGGASAGTRLPPADMPSALAMGPPAIMLELTCTTASRNGVTTIAAETTNAVPASAEARQDQSGPRALLSAAGVEKGREGQAQGWRRTQPLARSTMTSATVRSRGRGGRLLILARILSSPSAPGSTSSTAADSARRKACSRRSSGVVIRLPACLPAAS
ncbi:MAG: hypothetical protein J2P25_06240 [Nocardiopsaceae bacterium]|nr:hypothetical protein [Nocardiopsaceae bacterium]